jgi:tRNA threonylcarbamoyladenosine biosynthesis protein TsaB
MYADFLMSECRILAVDTATEACSAALYIDGEIEQKFELAPREHTQFILQMIESLLVEADLKMNQLDALAFGRGPGSFTGVRIATGVVQGIGFAADLPVVPISTLASIAQVMQDDHGADKVLYAIDARMGGV